jgi:hypothetical protein
MIRNPEMHSRWHLCVSAGPKINPDHEVVFDLVALFAYFYILC